jgi:glycine cleavage system regulatory protein
LAKNDLSEVIETYTELLRAHQLNIELLNTLEQTFFHIQNFCLKNNITIRDEVLSTSISKIEALLEEIDCKSP